MSPDQSSPTRLYATVVGAVLLIGGTLGFFHSSTFATPGDIEDALGFAVNGWINTLHIVVGAVGLLAAGYAARAYSLGVAILFGALAIWGFAGGSNDALLDRFPADEGENLVHAVLALLGFAAWYAERPRRERKPRTRPEPKERDKEADRDNKKSRRDKKKEREEKRRSREKKRAEKETRERESRSKAADADRSQRSESGDDSASRGDEPPAPRERQSRRRRRPPRPPA